MTCADRAVYKRSSSGMTRHFRAVSEEALGWAELGFGRLDKGCQSMRDGRYLVVPNQEVGGYGRNRLSQSQLYTAIA